MLENNGEKCFPMEKVIECCNWLMREKKQLVRNEAVFDPWNEITEQL